MRLVLSMICLLPLVGLAAAGDQEAADALKKAKAQVTQDRKTKTVTEVRFTSKSHGDPLLNRLLSARVW